MNEQKPPRIFANRVIRQLIDHSFSEDMISETRDFEVIRTAFRNAGGSWVGFVAGSRKDFDLIKKLVSAWGQMPDRKLRSKELT